MKYLDRIIDSQLKRYLDVFGAVLIEGPKWCGKTTTAEQFSKSVIRFQDPDMREEYLATANVKPSLLLEGETPRLIDEWQDAPVVWDAVRTAVDKRSRPGQFILTGSNTVDHSRIHHSGTGRIARMQMLPMSLWETQDSNGKVSLQELFDSPDKEIDGILRNDEYRMHVATEALEHSRRGDLKKGEQTVRARVDDAIDDFMIGVKRIHDDQNQCGATVVDGQEIQTPLNDDIRHFRKNVSQKQLGMSLTTASLG